MYRERFPDKSMTADGYSRPDDQAWVWRFMDLSKLISIIATETLPFVRLDKFQDPYEGFPPLGNRISESDLLDLPAEQRAKMVADLNRNTWNLAEKARQIIFVNCWSVNEHESAAMWKLYVSGSEGVAIRSNCGRLKNALSNALQAIDIAEVKYIDYRVAGVRSAPMDMLALSMHKRKSFEHERELRVVHWDSTEAMDIIRNERRTNSKKLIPIQVDRDALIERIFVSPTSPTWFKDLVDSVMSKYGVNKQVHRSSLEDGPVW
jgi:hypothetical protein